MIELTKNLIKELEAEVMAVVDSYPVSSFEPDGPVRVRIQPKEIGDWLWISTTASISGRTWDPSTDRVKGDPYGASTYNYWVGISKTLPEEIEHKYELDEWALVRFVYDDQDTDIGVWGLHAGGYISEVKKDGTVIFHQVTNEAYQDVSPSTQTERKSTRLRLLNVEAPEDALQQLSSRNMSIRQQAASYLGHTKNQKFVQPLIELLDDKSYYVREKAVISLSLIGGQNTIEAIATKLEDIEPVQRLTKRKLVSIGTDVIDTVTTYLTHSEKIVRYSAIEILDKIGGSKAVGLLIRRIENPLEGDLAKIIPVLGRQSDLQAVEVLISLSNSEDEHIRYRTIDALYKLEDKKAISPLFKLLTHKDYYTREKALVTIESLGWIPKNRDEKALMYYARRDFEKLAKLHKTSMELIYKACEDYRSDMLKALYKIGYKFDNEILVKQVYLLLNEGQSYERDTPIDILVKIGDKTAIDALIECFCYDESKSIRSRAAKALGELGVPRAIEPILKKFISVAHNHFLFRTTRDSLKELSYKGLPVGKAVLLALSTELKHKESQSLTRLLELVKSIRIYKSDMEQLEELLPSIRKKTDDKKLSNFINKLQEAIKLNFSLSDPNPIIRGEAVEKLGKIHFQDAFSITFLLPLLNDEDPIVRRAAARTLGYIRNGTTQPLLETFHKGNRRTKISSLIALGYGDDPLARSEILEILQKSKDPIIIQNAIWAVSKFWRGDLKQYKSQIKKLLLPYLTSDNLALRLNISAALRKLGDPEFIDYYLNAIKSPNRFIRKNASKALSWFVKESKTRRDEIIDALVIAAKDEYYTVRYNVVLALGSISGRKSRSVLDTCSFDQNKYVRSKAKELLKNYDGDERLRNVSSGSSVYVTTCNEDPADIDKIIRQLDSKDQAIHERAMWALAEMSPILYDRLLNVLNDPSKSDRSRDAVCVGLGKLGDPEAIPSLIKALKDKNEEVRQNAAWALAEIAHPKGIKALIKALEDESWKVRVNAVAGIGKIADPKTVDFILKAITDPDVNVRIMGVSYLRKFDDPRVFDVLTAALSDPQKAVRNMAQESLEEHKKSFYK